MMFIIGNLNTIIVFGAGIALGWFAKGMFTKKKP